MSYGKYGMKLKVQNMATPIANDPWYNLGALLGTWWGKNYNDRGVRKGETEARESIGLDAPSSAQPTKPTEQLYSQALQARAIGPKGNLVANPEQENQLKKYVSANKQMGFPVSNVQPRDLNAEKLDYLVDKYTQTPNPDSDNTTVSNLSNIAKSNLGNMDPSTLPTTDINELKGQIGKTLRSNGRTQYQIEQVIKNLEPELEAKIGAAKEMQFEGLLGALNKQIQAGELDNASMTYTKMLELNPNRAKGLQHKINRMWEPYDMQRKIDQKANTYLKNDPSLNPRLARNLATYGAIYSPTELDAIKRIGKMNFSSGTGSKGSSASGVKGSSGSEGRNNNNGSANGNKWFDKDETTILKEANEVARAYETLDDHGGYTDEEYNAAKNAQRAINKKRFGPYHQTTIDDVKAWAAQQFANGVTPDELIDIIAHDESLSVDERFKINSYIQGFKNDTGSVSDFRRLDEEAATTPKEEAKAKEEDLNSVYRRSGAVEYLDENGGLFGSLKNVAGWAKKNGK